MWNSTSCGAEGGSTCLLLHGVVTFDVVDKEAFHMFGDVPASIPGKVGES